MALYQQINVQGGIAGQDNEGALICKCTSYAEISGHSKIGGIAGKNSGEISNCENKGKINDSAVDNSEYIGGICGENVGTVLNCKNHGNVGYEHIGYFIGGIAGLTSGFIENCENNADILGRRNVGGIAGQMVPHYKIETGINTLSLLSDNIENMNEALEKSITDLETAADSGISGISETIAQIRAFESDFNTQAGLLTDNLSWLRSAQTYLDEISDALNELEEIPLSIEDKNIISNVREIIGRFDPKQPSSWYELTRELSRELASLISGLEEYPTYVQKTTEITNRIASALNGLLNEVVTGIKQFGEDSIGLVSNSYATLSGIASNAQSLADNFYEDTGTFNQSIWEAVDAINEVNNSFAVIVKGSVHETKDVSQECEA